MQHDLKCKQCGEVIPWDHAQVGGVHLGGCEHAYFHVKDQKMIKVRPVGEKPWCVMYPKDAEGLLALEPHDANETKEVFMSKGEIEAMPEFEGW